MADLAAINPRVLWLVGPFMTDQIVRPRATYGYDNRDRSPAGTVVAQLTLEGKLQFEDTEGRQHIVGPGQLLLFAYGEPTSYQLPDKRQGIYRCAWCCLEGPGLLERINEHRRQFGSMADTGRSALRRCFDRLLTLAQQRDQHTLLEQDEAVHRFVMELDKAGEKSRAANLTPVEAAVGRLLREPCRPWSLKDVAAEHGCTREHLTRVFHQTTGQPPAAYLSKARLNRAIDLLSHTDLPLSEVARQSGYASLHTMARHVRTTTGGPPGALRR
ncbi:MAG: AraC family transcriptional regulator [Phycisphaeraceae bacterium]|nr:AraC family transcriptional regulator [Phycisphaeraceae bacterium]